MISRHLSLIICKTSSNSIFPMGAHVVLHFHLQRFLTAFSPPPCRVLQ